MSILLLLSQNRYEIKLKPYLQNIIKHRQTLLTCLGYCQPARPVTAAFCRWLVKRIGQWSIPSCLSSAQAKSRQLLNLFFGSSFIMWHWPAPAPDPISSQLQARLNWEQEVILLTSCFIKICQQYRSQLHLKQYLRDIVGGQEKSWLRSASLYQTMNY